MVIHKDHCRNSLLRYELFVDYLDIEYVAGVQNERISSTKQEGYMFFNSESLVASLTARQEKCMTAVLHNAITRKMYHSGELFNFIYLLVNDLCKKTLQI